MKRTEDCNAGQRYRVDRLAPPMLLKDLYFSPDGHAREAPRARPAPDHRP